MSTVAEQLSHTRIWRPAPLPALEIDLTISLEVPEESGADIGIVADFEPRLPLKWEDDLEQQLFDGVYRGLARVDAPLPAGGLGIRIAQLQVSPPLTPESDTGDVLRLGDTLETLAAAAVQCLWSSTAGLSTGSRS